MISFVTEMFSVLDAIYKYIYVVSHFLKYSCKVPLIIVKYVSIKLNVCLVILKKNYFFKHLSLRINECKEFTQFHTFWIACYLQ